jgi:hypothetical protein
MWKVKLYSPDRINNCGNGISRVAGNWGTRDKRRRQNPTRLLFHGSPVARSLNAKLFLHLFIDPADHQASHFDRLHT